MANTKFIDFKGPNLNDLKMFGRKLNSKEFRLYTRNGLKKSLSPSVRSVKAITPKGPTGNLKRSIGAKQVKDAKMDIGLNPIIAMFIGARMKKKSKNNSKSSYTSGHHAHLVGYGHRASGKFKHARDPKGIGNWIEKGVNSSLSKTVSTFSNIVQSKVLNEFTKIRS